MQEGKYNFVSYKYENYAKMNRKNDENFEDWKNIDQKYEYIS